MTNFCSHCGTDLRSEGPPPTSKPHSNPAPSASRKKKRSPSAYNRFIGKELKRLRKKHPRTKQAQLMKKAAAAWRKKKRGR